MLSRFAHALLVSTSLAPVALVYGLSLLPKNRSAALVCFGVAAALLGACLFVLRVASRKGERQQVRVTRSQNVDKDVLAFLVSYALPLVAPAQGGEVSPAFWGFIALVAVVLYQAELVHVNPLLGMIGYRFYEVPRDGKSAALLVTRFSATTGDTRSIVKLSDSLWLESPP
jgi:hypothetical protein